MDATEPTGSGGGKRKYKENALTAKAESGTLRVKILRKDQQQALLAAATGANAPVRGARGAKTHGKSAAPPSPDSPPKPRPNRKHVPIFYQQKRRPRAENNAASYASGKSASNAFDLSGTQFSSSSSASSASALSTDYSGTGMSASTSSTGTAYASLLSGLQLDSTTGSAGNGGGASTSSTTALGTSIADLLPPPPATNPLFSRSNSDGLGALSELLRPHFPSATGPSFPLSGASSGILAPHMLLSVPTTSSTLSMPSSSSPGSTKTAALTSSFSSTSIGSTAALHQLASSSQQYRSALDALSAATIQSGSLDPTAATAPSLPAATLSTSSGSLTSEKQAEQSSSSLAHENGDSHVSEYKFNPLSALQSAIDHAQQLSQTLASKNQGKQTSSSSSRLSAERDGNRPSSGDGGIQHLLDDGSDEDAASSALLDPSPTVPPAFSTQNSLMGGGIEALISSSKAGSPVRDHDKPSASTPPLALPSRDLSLLLDTSNAADGDLGPPPAAPPAFHIENSLMGGGIETQPTIANVNTHNFEWKFHNAAGKLLKPSPSRGVSTSSKTLKVVEGGEGGRPSASSFSRRDDDKDSREAIL